MKKPKADIPFTFIDGKKFYTINDASALYGITRPTIYNWVKNPKSREKYKISTVRVGGKLLVRSEFETIF